MKKLLTLTAAALCAASLAAGPLAVAGPDGKAVEEAAAFTAEKDAGPDGAWSTYKPADFYALLDRFDNRNPGYYPGANQWASGIVKTVVPQELMNVLEGYRHKRRTEKFMALIYFDREGRIVTSEFRLSGALAQVVTPQHIRTIYDNLMKERVPIEPTFDPDSKYVQLERKYWRERVEHIRNENKGEGKSNELFCVRCNLTGGGTAEGFYRQ